MITADWIAIGVSALFLLLGFIVGFGRGLKFFTSGIFGFIISVVVCYFFGGIIFRLGFVQELLAKFVDLLSGKNGFCDFLLKIRIEVVVYYIALFIVVSLIRLIIVLIIKGIAEAGNPVMKIINKTFGMVLFAAVLVMLTLITFHIISWIGGGTAESFALKLDGSALKLDALFEKDLLVNVVNALKR